MKNLKTFLFLLLTICFSTAGFSQYYYYNDRYYDKDLIFEAGAGVGAMNCITDVGGANTDKTYYINEIRFKNTKTSYSVFGGIMYQNFIGGRLEATWGQVNSADKDIEGQSSYNIVTKRIRNLSFRSNITEVSLLAEFHPMMLMNFENGPPLFSPYITAGVGWFSFNPQTEYNGHYVALQPLHTEGEGFSEYKDVSNYKTAQANIPLGFGIRYELSALFNLRFEFLHRILFTDYLDDVSSRGYVNPNVFAKHLNPVQASYATALYNPSTDGKIPARRGNPDNNDSYMTFSVKLSLALGRDNVR